MHGKEGLLMNVQKLIEGLQILKIPVLYTEQYAKGLGETLPELKSLFNHDNPVEKMAFSCCDEQFFMSDLTRFHKKDVIIAGIEAHVCILQTVIDLLEKGYHPVVVEDCISSRKPHDKSIAIKRMRSEGAVITTYESVLFELQRVAGNASFKSISKLIK